MLSDHKQKKKIINFQEYLLEFAVSTLPSDGLTTLDRKRTISSVSNFHFILLGVWEIVYIIEPRRMGLE